MEEMPLATAPAAVVVASVAIPITQVPRIRRFLDSKPMRGVDTVLPRGMAPCSRWTAHRQHRWGCQPARSFPVLNLGSCTGTIRRRNRLYCQRRPLPLDRLTHPRRSMGTRAGPRAHRRGWVAQGDEVREK